VDAFGPRASIVAALERDEVIWLSSIRPDGRPHLVPVWFVWNDDSIVVFSKPGAQKVRNLRRDPRAMVAIGEATAGFDIELIEAEADVAPGSSDETARERFATKYEAALRRAASTVEEFATVYSQSIRLRPTRWLGWGGPGWTG
jgi:PPOX class probable F420-dependent enzyme